MSDYDSEDEYPESGSEYASRSDDDGFEGFEGDMGEVNTSTKRVRSQLTLTLFGTFHIVF